MSNPNLSQPFPGLVHRRDSGADLFVWSNREISKSAILTGAMIVGWIIFFPLALFLSISLLTDINLLRIGIRIGTGELIVSFVFVIVCWIAVIYLTFYLIRLTWTETIRVSDEGLSLQYIGVLAPKEKQIPENDIWRLSYEKLHTMRDRESRYTLNIFHGKHREVLAYWMRSSDKRHLFSLLQHVISVRDWPHIDFKLADQEE